MDKFSFTILQCPKCFNVNCWCEPDKTLIVPPNMVEACRAERVACIPWERVPEKPDAIQA
jgi:hypothetical protein